MKKIICLALLILLMPLYSFAEVIPHKIYACSLEEIGTKQIKAGEHFTFQVIEEAELSDIEFIEENSVITVKINQYIAPKRGKRNGYAKVNLIKYTIPSKGNEVISLEDRNICGTLRLSNPLDKKEILKNAGVSAAGHFLKIPGFSQAIAVSKGLINPNPEQNRLQSAGTNLYESTPLTYSEKGIDLTIEEDAIVVLTLKNKE